MARHVARLRSLPPETAVAVVGAVRGAFEAAGGLEPLEVALLDAIGSRVLGIDAAHVEALDATTAAEEITDADLRRRAVDLMVVLEMTRHPLAEDLQRAVADYARAFGVDEPMVNAARAYAEGHVAIFYSDLQRRTWYTEQVGHSMFHGGFWRIVRSKLAYEGVAPDRHIARRWQALASCPEGSWGRAVAEFYERHRFPLPGERHGITELGAHHDWVHVLAGYDIAPEDELDVFAFISAASDDPHAFTLLVTTLALFQNGAITHVAGKKVAIACKDALDAPGATERFADALGRGVACEVDVLAMDHFDHKDEPLDEVRQRFAIPPKAVV